MSVIKRISELDPYIPSNRDFDFKDWSYCDWNESQFSPSPQVVSNIKDFLLNGNIEKYPNTDNKQLLKLLSDYTSLKKENITIYNGSDDALKDIFLSFADEQTKILTYCPSYTQVDTFIAMSTSNHQKQQIHDPFGKHEYNFKILKNYNIAYIANPNNPTGHIIEKDIIEHIVASNPSTLFIVDEAYYEFCQVSCCNLVLKYDNIIVTRTFSKAFGLASLRIGYAISSNKNIKFLNKIKNVKSINSVAQVAAIASLQDLEYLNKCLLETEQSRKLLQDYINN